MKHFDGEMVVYSLTNPKACDSLDSLDSYFTLWMNMETTNYTMHETIIYHSAPLILHPTCLPLGLVVLYYPEKLIIIDWFVDQYKF